MSVIQISNVTVKGNGGLLNDATVVNPNSIVIDGLSIEKNAVVLENLNIPQFCQTAGNHTHEMTSEENKSFQELLRKKDGNSATFLKALCQHVANFTVGVLANVISSYISPNK